MIRVRDLSGEQLRNMARFVLVADQERKSDRQILLNLQISQDDLGFLRKFNDRTDHPPLALGLTAA